MESGEKTSRFKDEDEALLAELGYKQQLNRAWSGFSNFAISFSIISVLAGCFTAYATGWNNGGPIAISIGWPLVSVLILIIGFSLAELVAKYPTSGGIYWFAGKLGGPVWAWFTGWFNLVGLIGVVASVQYACAGFLERHSSALYGVDIFGINFGDAEHILGETFLLFLIILFVTAIVNIFRTHLLAVINNVSVWWHVAGVAVIIALLVIVPDTHQSFSFVFGERINNSGFDDGATGGLFFWIYLLPIGFLLTQYTITGFDASAHLSEETHGASKNGGPRRLAVDLLLGDHRLVRAPGDHLRRPGPGRTSRTPRTASASARRSRSLAGALDTAGFKAVLVICTVGQLFCGARLPHQRLADVLRVLARPRDARVAPPVEGEQGRGPVQRGHGDGRPGADHHDPGAEGRPGDGPAGRLLRGVSICVIGLYICYAIPIFLRWRMGTSSSRLRPGTSAASGAG